MNDRAFFGILIALVLVTGAFGAYELAELLERIEEHEQTAWR